MSEFDQIVQGASVSQLATIFDLNRRTVTSRLRTCPASGVKGGHKIYRIGDAAVFLLQLDSAEEDDKKRQPAVEKDYWEARLKQQKFEENQGDLMRVADVALDVAVILKNISLQAKLLTDNVERELGVTNDQRDAINRLVDEFLYSASETVATGRFGDEFADEKEDDDDIFGPA